MPLVAPNLDDRTFEDLVTEARSRIARYAPQWTDFNDSDPGMTLVQLFAWMTELLIYRMNKVPDLNYVKFLQLLGLRPRPAQAATAYLTFTPARESGPITLPPGSQVSAPSSDGGPAVVFETQAGLDLVLPVLSELQVDDGNDFQVVSNQNDPASPDFFPLGWVPAPGNALYLGFDPAKPKVTPPAGTPVFPPSVTLRVFLNPAAQAGAPQACGDPSAPASPPVSPVTIAWEYKPDDTRPWRRLPLKTDTSAGFTREGDIEFGGPAEITATDQGKPSVDPANPGKPALRYWLRARLESGSYPTGKAPSVSFLRVNTVAAVNVSTVNEESLGFSDGSPNQVFKVAHAPVLPGDRFPVSLESQAGDREPWTLVDDFLASGPDDAHFLLAADTGEVTFGDGKRGRIPGAGGEVIVERYRYGGGSGGNVPAGTIASPVTDLGNLKVTNERPAVGGRDEQDVDELKAEAPAFLRCRGRAVTADDFAAIAAQAGGVARAASIPLAHPSFPGASIPGAVTVVIVPDTLDDRPEPTPDQVAATCRYLNPFRLITTEVFVAGPSYRRVSVQARVTARPQLAADAVSQGVTDAINTHLDPLGRSWSKGVPTPVTGATADAVRDKPNEDFGRAFYPSRLYAVILGVDGVVAVDQLFVLVDDRFVDIGQTVAIPRDGLVYGTASGHLIRVDPARGR